MLVGEIRLAGMHPIAVVQRRLVTVVAVGDVKFSGLQSSADLRHAVGIDNAPEFVLEPVVGSEG